MTNHKIDNILALYTQDQRINTTYPDSRRQVLPHLIRDVATSADAEGAIIYSTLNEANADAEIRAQIAFFTEMGQNFEWKVYDYDTPPRLHERLASHGFEVEEAEAIMVLDLADAPASLFHVSSHDIRRITHPAELEDVRMIKEAVWQDDANNLIAFLTFTLTEHPELMSIYVAYVDGAPASAAWIYFPEGSQFASLWGGSTLAEHRGKGLYSGLLAIRAREAQARGRRFLTVDASPMSRPILEKFGFVQIAVSYPCLWTVG
ncbi:MAG: hypothetical protein R3A44_02405 [Caldilineaceae bacterium]